MEKLWDRNIAITTRLVDTVTTPMLLKVLQSGKLDAKRMGTHSFALADVMEGLRHFRKCRQGKRLEGDNTGGVAIHPPPDETCPGPSLYGGKNV